MHKTNTDEEILEEFNNFDLDKFSLILSTSNDENEPLTSYSPFVKKNENYYICISSALPHYENMMQTKRAHVMIIEDEQSAGHIYARKRLYFSVECKEEGDAENIFKLFDDRYAESLSFLREMKDFKVISLTPKEKSLVLGFGAAYKMNTDGSLVSKNIQHK